MKPSWRVSKTASMATLLSAVTLSLAGCANPGAQVLCVANREITALNADGIVCVMQRAGFSDDQILDLGTDLRNALASSGAAKIRVGGKIDALFAVDGDSLHVSSRLSGSFIYDLQKRTLR